MKLIIHRGAHEIGGSCVEIIYNQSRIIIDIGVPLVDDNGKSFEMNKYDDVAGPELVKKGILPDVKGLYSWDNSNKKVEAIFISHPHIDHYGYLKHVDQTIPVYIGKAANQLIDITVLFTGLETQISWPNYLESGKSISLSDFKITPYLMDHSAFDAYSFLIEAGGKRILYSGDFRDHGRKRKAFDWFLANVPEKIDALILEGTVFGRQEKDFLSESEIEDEMIKIEKNTTGIILIHQSSQNIDRLVSFYRASLKTNRLFVVDIYTAHILEALKDFANIPYPSNKFPNIRVFYPYFLSNRIVNEAGEDYLYQLKYFKICKEEIAANSSKIMMLVRPSMQIDLNKINSFKDSAYVYSLWEGYLKEESMKKILSFIKNEDINFYQLHTSGHASLNTLKKMVNSLKPKSIIPIHTFHPEKYQKLNAKIRIVHDGECVDV